jgi:hypothetical protein
MAVYRFSIETNVFLLEKRKKANKQENPKCTWNFFVVREKKKQYKTIFRPNYIKTKRTSFYLDQNTILKKLVLVRVN